MTKRAMKILILALVLAFTVTANAESFDEGAPVLGIVKTPAKKFEVARWKAACAAFKQKDYKVAVELFKALRAESYRALYTYNLAQALRKSGDFLTAWVTYGNLLWELENHPRYAGNRASGSWAPVLLRAVVSSREKIRMLEQTDAIKHRPPVLQRVRYGQEPWVYSKRDHAPGSGWTVITEAEAAAAVLGWDRYTHDAHSGARRHAR